MYKCNNDFANFCKPFIHIFTGEKVHHRGSPTPVQDRNFLAIAFTKRRIKLQSTPHIFQIVRTQSVLNYFFHSNAPCASTSPLRFMSTDLIRVEPNSIPRIIFFLHLRFFITIVHYFDKFFKGYIKIC